MRKLTILIMKFIQKTEFKFFITFFLISLLFVHWTSWNEETNFALTKAIVNERSFYLEKYQNITGDILCFYGHCFAGYTRLVFSCLSSFIYTFLKFLCPDENLIKFSISVLTSSMFFSLSVLLIYKLSKKLLKKESHSIFISLFFGFSTLAFQQARFFTTHSTETFLASLSLYYFFQFSKKINSTKKVIICATIIGIGSCFAPVLRIFSLIFFLTFILKRENRKAIIFLIVVFFIYTQLLMYLSVIGVNLIKDYSIILYTTTHIIYPSEAIAKVSATSTITVPYSAKQFLSRTFPLSSFLQLLIFPSKGILFYYPILAFSFLGFLVFKKYRFECLSLLLLILLTLGALSFDPRWWLGWVSYGPSRALTVLMPFFAIGLMGFVNRFGVRILIPFFLISVLNNFLLLQYGEDKISTLSWEDYKYRMENFQILSNPLFEHYLPLTLINGPRSVLIENLILNKKIDIGLKHPFNPTTPEFIPDYPIVQKFEVRLFSLCEVGIVVLRLPFLSLFVTTCIILLIWKDEILSKLKINSLVLIFILIFVFFFAFIRVRNFVYGDGWYAPEWHDGRVENSRWMGQNTTIILFSKNPKNETLEIDIESFNKTRTLELYLNNEFVNEYKIDERKKIFQAVELVKGENEIKFISKEGCDRPFDLSLGNDVRCLSFKVDINFYDNWKDVTEKK